MYAIRSYYENYITEAISSAGANVITIYPSQEITSISMSKNFNERDLSAVEKVRGVELVLYGWFGGSTVKYGDEEYFSDIFATKGSVYSYNFV